MHRIISDGATDYVLMVDDTPGVGGRARTAQALRFPDEAEALAFLQRVADDYPERAALRELYAATRAREDLYQLPDAQLFARLAELIVGGEVEVVTQPPLLR